MMIQPDIQFEYVLLSKLHFA